MGLEFSHDGESINYTPGTAKSSGDVVRWIDGRAAVVVCDTAANKLGAVRLGGIFKGSAASAATWSAGAPLFWDSVAEAIVKGALTLQADEDIYLGTALTAKTNGQTEAYVILNGPNLGHGLVMQQAVYEFDVQTGVDATAHILIPAEMNPNGLMLYDALAVITEAMVGSSQDQGIVAIKDTDDTAICTFTPTDGAADAIGDLIKGTGDATTAATGDAGVFVAAGKGVKGIVSQATSGGSPAGKMKVYLLFLPLL